MSAPAVSPFDLTDRTVLVTGASSGLGRDACRLLVELGARVVLVARNEERLRETAATLPAERCWIRPFDVTRHAETADWMTAIAADYGPLFGLVHLAGVSQTEAVRFLDFERLEAVIDINLKSAFSLAKAFRQKPVRAHPEARLILTASVSALRGYPGMAAYSASKGGIVALTRQMAVELARENIRVNALAPGLVRTEMTAADRDQLPPAGWEALEQAHLLGVGRPRDVSMPIAFLLSEAARWMTGQTLVVDGGLTIH